MFQAFVCDAQTGAKLDTLPVSAFTWNKYMSAGGSGEATVVLDGSHTQAQLGDLFRHWRRLFVLEYDGKVLFGGIITSHTYQLGTHSLKASLTDLWGLLARRLAVDLSVPLFSKWKITQNVSLAQHAANALVRARDTAPPDPDPAMPVTIPGFGGTAVSRTWYGYHAQTVEEVWRQLMDEGLDIFLEPRWIGNGDFDWIMRAAPGWNSGKHHEFFVTAQESDVSGFTTTYDGARITTNAVRVGEGSEEDMLYRSDRRVGSVFPRLDRVTADKSVSNVSQLAAMADNDLVLYGSSTSQWELRVPVASGVEVGDLVTLNFADNLVISDGFHTRRVVSVSGDMSEKMTIRLQPAGGA